MSFYSPVATKFTRKKNQSRKSGNTAKSLSFNPPEEEMFNNKETGHPKDQFLCCNADAMWLLRAFSCTCLHLVLLRSFALYWDPLKFS